MATLLSAGCRGDGPPGTGQGDPDSPSEVEQWSLSEVPLLEIGVVEGDPAYQLHEAVSSARLPDGRVAVVNRGSQEVRFYSPDGRHILSVGGDKVGPDCWRSDPDSPSEPRPCALRVRSRANPEADPWRFVRRRAGLTASEADRLRGRQPRRDREGSTTPVQPPRDSVPCPLLPLLYIYL